ncbi:MAG: FtsX-like permease family protein, partial [Holophagaceae bacterium]|nr:FtsX-like permease family protein [Holophagaceae bacterium]
MSTTKDGALNAVDVEVVGLQDFGFQEPNDRFLSVSLATAGAAGGRRRRAVAAVRGAKGSGDARPRRHASRKWLAPTWREPWMDLASFYQQVKLLYLAIFGFMGLVLFLVVLLATANTLLMSVMERLREFGTLRAVGLQPGQLLALLQWEGAILGALGSALGIVLTLLLRAGVNALHVQLPPPQAQPRLRAEHPRRAHGVPRRFPRPAAHPAAERPLPRRRPPGCASWRRWGMSRPRTLRSARSLR